MLSKLVLLVLVTLTGYRFNRIALIPDGVPDSVERLLIGDTNHDGNGELIFTRGGLGWAIWEYKPMNEYELVYEKFIPLFDTFFLPRDVGDGDKDGKSEICGCLDLWRKIGENEWDIIPGVGILESKNQNSYPTECVFYDSTFFAEPLRYVDLDNDSKQEIFCLSHDKYVVPPKGIVIYKNRGDNLYPPVWNIECDFGLASGSPGPFTFGDFDKDGRGEFFCICRDSAVIYKCFSEDDYRLVWKDYHWRINTFNSWLGNDTDGDSWPEIFVENHWYGSRSGVALTMYEATSVNTYKLVEIDTVWRGINFMEGRSTCGDVDGDGIEEVVFSIGSEVFVYKATGDDKYEQVWEWRNDMARSAVCICRDLNKNGYDEIYISGDNKTSVFEIDKASIPENKIKTPVVAHLSVSPNLIKNSAVIKYSIPKEGRVELTVYDALGRAVEKLIDREVKTGIYTIAWQQKELPAGIYFIQLKAGNSILNKKITILK